MRPMKTTLLVSLFFGLFSFAFLPSAYATPKFELSKKVLKYFYEADAFLTHLGYKNFSGMSQDTLEDNPPMTAVAQLVLDKNVHFYASLNSAKYVADLSYAFLKLNGSMPNSVQSHNLKLLIDVAVQQSAPFPLIGLEPILDPQYPLAQGKAALNLRIKYLGARAVSRYTVEKENLIKTYSYLYRQLENGPDKSMAGFQAWADRRFTEVLWDYYTLSNIQQNRYLGRAMILILVRYARENGNSGIESELRDQLLSMGIHLDDIITAKYRPVVADKLEPTYQMKSGDLAMEFSNGHDAYFTSVGVEPGTPENKALAKKYDLISSYTYLPLFLSQNYYDEALDRKRSNLVLNNEQQKVLTDFWDPRISKGYSHIGIVEVKRDVKTGISVAWIWDCYPGGGVGGIRLMTPEGFSFPERYVRVGFARYGADQVRAAYKNQFKTRGYLAAVMESKGSFVALNTASGHNEPYVDPDKRYRWPSKISEREARALATNSDMDSEVWYQQKILPKVFQQIEKYIYTNQALAFATNLVNAESMSYCSQFIRTAYLQGVNFDPAPVSDQLRPLPGWIAKHFPDKVDLDTDGGFVAPAGLAWQADLVVHYVKYDYTHDRAEIQTHSRWVADTYTNYLAHDIEVQRSPLEITPQKILVQQTFIADDLSY
jgi:hypothetical protein